MAVLPHPSVAVKTRTISVRFRTWPAQNIEADRHGRICAVIRRGGEVERDVVVRAQDVEVGWHKIKNRRRRVHKHEFLHKCARVAASIYGRVGPQDARTSRASARTAERVFVCQAFNPTRVGWVGQHARVTFRSPR